MMNAVLILNASVGISNQKDSHHHWTIRWPQKWIKNHLQATVFSSVIWCRPLKRLLMTCQTGPPTCDVRTHQSAVSQCGIFCCKWKKMLWELVDDLRVMAIVLQKNLNVYPHWRSGGCVCSLSEHSCDLPPFLVCGHILQLIDPRTGKASHHTLHCYTLEMRLPTLKLFL